MLIMFLFAGATFYVVPIESILGKLSVVQAGDTGTIPFEHIASSPNDVDDLCELFYPGGRADSEAGSGTVAYKSVGLGLVTRHLSGCSPSCCPADPALLQASAALLTALPAGRVGPNRAPVTVTAAHRAPAVPSG